MLNEKRLYVIVSDYPYGNGEPFLEDELVALAKEFDKVFLIITNPVHLHDLSHKFSVPVNVEIKFYIPKNNLATRLRGLWFSLSEPAVKEELKIIRKNYKQPISISRLRLLFSYVIHGLEFHNYIEKLINSDNTHKASNYLYTYWCTYYTFGLALLKSNYKSIKTFTRVHRWDLYMNVHNPPYLPFRKLISEKLDKIFSVSEDGKKYLLETIPFIEKDKIKVSFLGTTVNRKPTPVKPEKKIVILSISFISKIKRVDLLAQAISLISDFEIEWHHIGGGGEEAKVVEDIADKLLSGKTNISYRFYGNLPKKEIYNFLDKNNIHVLINTSLSEGLPVSIMEAMSYGIPVIATDVGGSREIVTDNINGILLNSNPQKEEVAEAIKKIFTLDSSSYITLSENAYNTWNTKFNNTKNNEKFISKVLSLDDEMYRVCSRCIIDNIDYPEIEFDNVGVCNICKAYDNVSTKYLLSDIEKEKKLTGLINELKESRKNHEYDCIIGASGGVDSCYVVYKAKEFGLRPLIVHLDNGWNSELAVKNIENMVRKLGFDLYTHVINWNEFKDLQLSFFKASVIDIELLTDHAISAILLEMASKHGIKYILSGENIVTEGRLPPNWVHYKNDLINIKDIHNKFGKVLIKTFPTLGIGKLFYYQRIKKIKNIQLLDYLDYNKQKAKEIITRELEWRDYGGKHYESVFTRFYQSYILPVKFHADKRKSHYSTLICSGQLTRVEALELMRLPIYEKEKLSEDKQYVIKKLGLTENEFDTMMKQPARRHTDFSSVTNYINKLSFIKNLLKKLIGST
jgi:N-acetyl sugar amidotransferase